jgi:hypothetical protein
LSAKLVPTFADKESHVVSVTDPYGRILAFLHRVSISTTETNLAVHTLVPFLHARIVSKCFLQMSHAPCHYFLSLPSIYFPLNPVLKHNVQRYYVNCDTVRGNVQVRNHTWRSSVQFGSDPSRVSHSKPLDPIQMFWSLCAH